MQLRNAKGVTFQGKEVQPWKNHPAPKAVAPGFFFIPL
jgi:hypothetical protein